MAAPIVSLEDIALRQGDGLLFDQLSLFIGAKDRLALIGRNGAGKTTLLRLIAGTLEPDKGRRSQQPGQRIVLLPQDPPVAGFETLADFALAEPDAPPRHEVEAIATQLGLDLELKAANASGGERRRAAIARALAQQPDLLLLDEPTNHLDLEAIDWLEGWLTRYTGAFLVISHDRTFLTRLTKACLWLDRGQLRRQEVGFGGFEAWTEAVYAEEAKIADKLDTKIAQELHWLQRGVTARRRRNQGRLERLHQMRASRKAMLGVQGTAKLALATDDVKSKMVIEAEGVSKTYGDRAILTDFSIRIQRGDRIGIVGPNGAGKTTLLRLLTGDLQPDEGTVTRAKTLNGIAIDQQRKLMEPTKRVRDVLADGGDWIEVRGHKTHIQGYLKQFLFPPSVADAKIGTFSGGERSRLLLAREFSRDSNLLVLDEPTNDLDLETLDLLQEVISDYEGTVLIVSHDRDFLDRTTTMTIGLDGSGRADVVAGGYRELEQLWQERAAKAKKAAPPKAAPSPAAPSGPAKKLSFKDQHDLDRLPGEIAKIEAGIAAAEAKLADPALYSRDPKQFDRLTGEIDTLRGKLEAAELRWMEVAEKAEALG
ncbi:ABC-F family ATP-binding cassette domain-containing protein [Sandaracinobacter neustonicus]|uniref:ABC-F family ATP-binding cassette domain-containing protein n=1 Tax=Sandaracinobacter neustonicus TaxID=1715348 RepID=A0A501XV19_9SPHN|nr:ABC-F family ATP-binding cassette domain-containing protein [Sandaracinobacter neustonicus]TPE63954.1 ABC-F family ATP-binding cassette domain-containing protein [Sandaracinobacter neustonicus]